MKDQQQFFAEAVERFRAKDPDAAEALLRQGLADRPDHAPSLNLLALIVGRAGRYAECVALLERAIEHGETEQAIASGLLLAAAHRRAGHPKNAEDAYRRVLATAPESREALVGLGLLLHGQGRHGETVASLRLALAQREEPALLNTLGVALKEEGRLDDAAASFERAVVLRPGFIDALYNLGLARKDQGRTDEAVVRLRDLAALAPDLAAARFALCMAHLSPLYRDQDEVERRRADYAAELDALVAHADRVGAGALSLGVGAAQPFYLAYQGRNDVDLQRRYGALVCRAMSEAFPAAPLADRPGPGERIRVGFICGHIRRHPVWRLPTRGWVEGLDRARFELIAYHTSAIRDAETERARGLFDRFHQGPLPTGAWRDRIAADRPHALIYPEVGMDPEAARLAALRLAPTQYASWGHPSTTGYPTIDYFLSSADMEPEDGDGHYSERLVRLPGLSTVVAPEPAALPVPARASLGLPPDTVVYWCGQSLYKYLPRHDAIFPAIAARVPDCRFVFVEFPGSPALTQRFRDRLAKAFVARGLDAERSCLLLPRLGPDAFHAAMGCADVVLDSIGWSGCNSLIDALAHALPIVTMPGDTMRSRHGAAILRQLGLEASICADEQAYIEAAAALGIDQRTRESASMAIRSGLLRLNRIDPVAALERHIMAACA